MSYFAFSIFSIFSLLLLPIAIGIRFFPLRSISARTGAAASFGPYGISTTLLAQRYSGTRDGLHLFCEATKRLPARPKKENSKCDFYMKTALKTKEV